MRFAPVKSEENVCDILTSFMKDFTICFRETIAAKVMRFSYGNSDEYVSGILTKPLSNEEFHY
jgi:hypothetical protein